MPLLKQFSDRKADEFVCADCGANIVSFPAFDPPPTVCGLCLHLREFVPDEAERITIANATYVKMLM